MDAEKINSFILTYREYFSNEDMALIRQHLEITDDSRFTALMACSFKDPNKALMLSIFGGPIGIDRFYIGDNVAGIIKTITCGGILIWAFIDQFLIRKATRNRNLETFFKVVNSQVI